MELQLLLNVLRSVKSRGLCKLRQWRLIRTWGLLSVVLSELCCGYLIWASSSNNHVHNNCIYLMSWFIVNENTPPVRLSSTCHLVTFRSDGLNVMAVMLSVRQADDTVINNEPTVVNKHLSDRCSVHWTKTDQICDSNTNTVWRFSKMTLTVTKSLSAVKVEFIGSLVHTSRRSCPETLTAATSLFLCLFSTSITWAAANTCLCCGWYQSTRNNRPSLVFDESLT